MNAHQHVWFCFEQEKVREWISQKKAPGSHRRKHLGFGEGEAGTKLTWGSTWISSVPCCSLQIASTLCLRLVFLLVEGLCVVTGVLHASVN